MAFSIKQIKAVLSEHGLPVENLDKAAEEICGRHTADLDSIKEQRDTFKKDAETLATVQKELDDLKKAQSTDNYKEKYEQLKAEITAKETKKAKTDAYRELLKGANIDEKRIATILRAEAPTIDKIELDADGKIKNAEQYTESIKSDWADFIVTQSAKGTNTATPPANGGAATTKTKEDILKIKDAGERQKAIAENPTLFGID